MSTDLDSIASAVGYAYFASHLSQTTTNSATRYRYVPLYQANREDLILRPENKEAFDRAGIDPSLHVLWLDELDGQEAQLSGRGIKYALVDGNNLPARFSSHQESTDEQAVVGIIDHHEDLGSFKHAPIRWIQVPTGSCSSLVTEYFYHQLSASNVNLPKGLADFILSAIIIDTDNIKPAPKGKAVEADISAASHLFPLSSFAAIQNTILTSSIPPSPSSKETKVEGTSPEDPRNFLYDWHQLLVHKKYDLSPLQGRDLLRRDYKEYESEIKHVRYGLSSVPMALQEWLDRPEIGGKWENILISMERWRSERNLDIVGVLTSYVRIKKNGGTKKGREQLYLVRSRGADSQTLPQEQLRDILVVHLAKDETLELTTLRIGDPQFETGSTWKAGVVAFEQGITSATRKQVAPALKKAIETVES